MTVEELKIEAKKLGYSIIKNNPIPKILPCTCGRKRMEKWYSCQDGKDTKVDIVCPNCDREATGTTLREAIDNWNKMICSSAPTEREEENKEQDYEESQKE